MATTKTAQFYGELDKVFSVFAEFLNQFNSSTTLQDYALQEFTSFFYANLINNFFTNLTKQNLKELNLPIGEIRKIRRDYQGVLKDIRAGLSLKGKVINVKYYSDFKSSLEEKYPKCLKVLKAVEKTIGIGKANRYLKQKEKLIRKLGKTQIEFQDILTTALLQIFIDKNHRIPNSRETAKLIKMVVTPEFLKKMSLPLIKELNQTSPDMLAEQSCIRSGFEARLRKTWHQPLDLLECLIKIAEEAGEEKSKLLAKSINASNNYQISAIIKMHARAVQIANEILTLLKAGYADGANVRWRSLYELTVVAQFLKEQDNYTAERYFAHSVMKQFTEANDYQSECRKIGYTPLKRSEFNAIKKQHDALVLRFGKEFEYHSGYEWVVLAGC